MPVIYKVLFRTVIFNAFSIYSVISYGNADTYSFNYWRLYNKKTNKEYAQMICFSSIEGMQNKNGMLADKVC